jgi:putative transposase
MNKRRIHSPEFKAKVAMEAISGRKTIQEIAANHGIHPIQVWGCPGSMDRSLSRLPNR